MHSTADGGDELVTAHMREHQKIRNIRRDPRVAVTIVSTDRSGPQTPYPSIKGAARVEEGGAPELLDNIATTIFCPGTGFPPPGAPPEYLTHSLRFRNFAQPSELRICAICVPLSSASGVKSDAKLDNALCADHDAVLFTGQTAAMVHQEAA